MPEDPLYRKMPLRACDVHQGDYAWLPSNDLAFVDRVEMDEASITRISYGRVIMVFSNNDRITVFRPEKQSVTTVREDFIHRYSTAPTLRERAALVWDTLRALENLS